MGYVSLTTGRAVTEHWAHAHPGKVKLEDTVTDTKMPEDAPLPPMPDGHYWTCGTCGLLVGDPNSRGVGIQAMNDHQAGHART